MSWLTEARWSPYAVGVGIGLLSWLTFRISRKPIGCSSAYARTSGMIEKLLRGEKVNQKLYYRSLPPVVDWEWMLVLGIVIGAFVSASISGNLQLHWVSSRWASAFGTDPLRRLLMALLGGVCLGFGARWTGGCTSGHGISGTLQLALSSWIAVICFFIGGIAAAFLLFNILHLRGTP